MRIDPTSRRVSLTPTDPAFYEDPYAAFAAIRAVAPVFFWEELGLWCLTGYDAVNGIFRDRRFGREILHAALVTVCGDQPIQRLELAQG